MSRSVGEAIGKLLYSLIVAIVGAIRRSSNRATQRGEWPRIAKRLGFHFDRERLVGEIVGDTVSGTLTMRLEHQTGGDRSVTRTIVEVACDSLPTGLDLAVVSKWDMKTPPNKRRRGDLRFDEVVARGGSDVWRLALVDAEQQTTIAAAMSAGWRLQAGALRRELAGVVTKQIDTIIAEARALIEILAVREDDAAHLAERVRSGPEDARVAAFATLDEVFRDQPATLALAESLLGDALAGIRLRAAIILADVRTLTDLAASGEPADLRAAAIGELTAYPQVPMVQRTIAQLVADDLASEVAPALASALSVVPHPDAEGVLVKLLDDLRDAVVAPAVDSLAVLGSVDAVMRLSALAKARPKHAVRVRAAVAAIQGRVGENAAGGLALADAEGGELALA